METCQRFRSAANLAECAAPPAPQACRVSAEPIAGHRVKLRLACCVSVLAMLPLGCSDATGPAPAAMPGREHLQARLGTVVSAAPGRYDLNVTTNKDAMLLVPAAAASGAAIPLVLLL